MRPPEPKNVPVTVYDGTGLVAGRLATHITKKLLKGERVEVINAEKIVITGTRERVFSEAREKRDRGKIRKGPYYPRTPHLMFKRIVRGMLPWDRAMGRAAHKRLHCHIGVPAELKDVPAERPEAAVPGDPERVVTMAEISAHLGFSVKEV